MIEFQGIEQLVQLPVFSNLFHLDVMLLQTMEGQLGLVINENLQRLKGIEHQTLVR